MIAVANVEQVTVVNYFGMRGCMLVDTYIQLWTGRAGVRYSGTFLIYLIPER